MNQKQRAEAFLKEYKELCLKYQMYLDSDYSAYPTVIYAEESRDFNEELNTILDYVVEYVIKT